MRTRDQGCRRPSEMKDGGRWTVGGGRENRTDGAVKLLASADRVEMNGVCAERIL